MRSTSALPIVAALLGTACAPFVLDGSADCDTHDGGTADVPDAGSSGPVRLLPGHFVPVTQTTTGLVYRDRDAVELRFISGDSETPVTLQKLTDIEEVVRLTTSQDFVFRQPAYDATKGEGPLEVRTAAGENVTLTAQAPELLTRRTAVTNDRAWMIYFERAESGVAGAHLMARAVAGGAAKRLGETVWSEGCGARLMVQAAPSTQVLAWGCPNGSTKRTLRSYDAANGLAETLLLDSITHTGLLPKVTSDRASIFVPNADGNLVRLPIGGGEAVVVGPKVTTVFPNADGTAYVARTSAGGLLAWDATNGARTASADGGVDLLYDVNAAATHALLSTKNEKHSFADGSGDFWSHDVVLVELATAKTEVLLADATGAPSGFTSDGNSVIWRDSMDDLALGRAVLRAVAGGTTRVLGRSVANVELLPNGTISLDANYTGGPNYTGDARMAVTVVPAPFDEAPVVVADDTVAGKFSHFRDGLGYVLDSGAASDGLYWVPYP